MDHEDEEFERNGPALRARQEGRRFGVRLLHQAFVPRIDESGRPRSKLGHPDAITGPCRICPARCCSMVVRLALPEGIHLSRTLQVPFFSALTLVASDHPYHAFRLDPDPRWVANDGPWSGRAELALRRREDGSCHALVEIGGYLRCGIYAARPSFCRTYPVKWTSDVAEGGPVRVVCPIPYGVSDAEALLLEQEIERSIEGWELHDDVVDVWNRGPGPFTAEAFVAFAVPRVAREMGIEVPDALVYGTPTERLDEAMHRSPLVRTIPGVTNIGRMYAGIPVKPEPHNPAK